MVPDVIEYVSFIFGPQPLETWCMQQEPRWLEDGSSNPAWRSDGSLNPAWRPFISGLSESAVAQSRTILFGLFEYLYAIECLASNPLRAAQWRKPTNRVKALRHYLDKDTWQTLLQHIETWPQVTLREKAHYARSRLLVEFLYLTGQHLAEIAGATTRMIDVDRGQRWLKVTGKGNVTADIPLPVDALAAIRRYRDSTGRLGLPSPTLDDPLLMDICAKGRPLMVETVAHIMKA